MPPPLLWSKTADHQIHVLREAGATWDEIAAALQVSRWSAIARGRRIGAITRERRATIHHVNPRWREPLEAGHPIAWDALTAGTLLASTPYPWPPFPTETASPCLDELP